MQVVEGDLAKTPIWDAYADIILERAGVAEPFEAVERFALMNGLVKRMPIVATGERAPYANLILKKGVIT